MAVGDMWISVDCHECQNVILVAPVPEDQRNASEIQAIFDEAQPVRCPHCSHVSEYRLAEIVCLVAAQSH
jgi:DNA-directed RNA polymerase subunit RPC12/RpoP